MRPSDLILLLGKEQDISEDYMYDTANVEGFFVPAGTAVELYATTLHYAPCQASEEGFRCVIVLPEGTNFPSEKENVKRTEEDKLLCMKNKWVLTHPESGEDFYPGLKGDILTV